MGGPKFPYPPPSIKKKNTLKKEKGRGRDRDREGPGGVWRGNSGGPGKGGCGEGREADGGEHIHGYPSSSYKHWNKLQYNTRTYFEGCVSSR